METREILDTILIPAQLATAMIGMGLTLKVKDFASVLKTPRGLFVGFALQLITVPLLAFAWAQLFGLGTMWQLGLLMCAAVPGGAWSNLLTYFARANLPLSISVTLTTTALAMVTTPLILKIFASDLLPPKVSIDVWNNIYMLAIYAILPLTVAIICSEKLPERLTVAASKWFLRITTGVLIAIVVLSMTSGRIKIGQYGIMPPIYVISFLLLLMVVTPHITRVLRFPDEDTIALSIEVVVRNINIALFMIPTLGLTEDMAGIVTYVCLAFGGMSGVFAIPYVVLGRWRIGSVVFGRRANYRTPAVVTRPVTSGQ